MQLSLSKFRPGFDWVAQDLMMAPDAKEALFTAVHASLYAGMRDRLTALKSVWPPDGKWPSGRRYLQDALREELAEEDEWHAGDPLPSVDEYDVFKLLLIRFSHVAQRLYRNQQIRDAYTDDTFRRRHPFIVMNREPSEAHALCGRGSHVKLSIEEGMRLMEKLVCEHPACACTFDPHNP